LLSLGFAAAACERSADGVPETADAPGPAYIGGGGCTACHADQAARWIGSHHDLAMQPADESSVLGDFGGAQFSYGGVTSTFFRRDGGFWVRTDGADGTLAEFEITHTFGVEPLQQYLVAFPGGRRQALGIAWDSRPAAAGGARWFHLYPDGGIDATDPLHWTGNAQNWNAICAECHSTALDKNYSVAADAYETAWVDVDVHCEACHGPGSRHAADPAGAPLALPAVARAWVFQDDSGIATRVPSGAAEDEVEACAQCHARRSQHGESFRPGNGNFLDAFRPALLDAELYFPDGQIRDEVYVYGSFLQSKMHAAGVTCSDCHDPHSAELRADGNALCSQCHSAARFDTRDHHRHTPGGDGSRCVDCHMPARTYMVVDPRRDHSFRVPRPDLSAALDAPNACNTCHADRTSDWAAAAVAGWYPGGRHTQFHYGEAIAAGGNWSANRGELLQRIVTDAAEPAIVRATGVRLLAEQLDDGALGLVAQQLSDPAPLVRLAALDALGSAPPAFAATAAQRFLTDPSQALRSAAARALLPARGVLSERRRADLDRALDEYRAAQTFNMDRAEGHFNWGTALAVLGRVDEAERSFRAALEREPGFSPASINLADLVRRDGRETEAQAVLREALAKSPDDPNVHLALGLSLVRSGQLGAALDLLARAAELAPRTPRFQYTLGVALYSTEEPARGLDALRLAHERFPGHAGTLVALATILRDRGEIAAAIEYARKLAALAADDASARRLLDELETLR
jgi:predicted CXXCH cytochrome family protein